MTYRMRNILIAVALAGFAALLVTFYVSNYKTSVQHQQARSPSLVAAKDIPQDTMGSRRRRERHAEDASRSTRAAVVPGRHLERRPDQDFVATHTIYAGEQVTTRRFGPLVQQGIQGQLTGTQRAVQIAGDPNQVLAGDMEPGDTSTSSRSSPCISQPQRHERRSVTFSRIVVRNLKVLEVQTLPSPATDRRRDGRSSACCSG